MVGAVGNALWQARVERHADAHRGAGSPAHRAGSAGGGARRGRCVPGGAQRRPREHRRRLDLALGDRPVLAQQRRRPLARDRLEPVAPGEVDRPPGGRPGSDERAACRHPHEVLDQRRADAAALALGDHVGVADEVDVAHALDAHDPDERAVFLVAVEDDARGDLGVELVRGHVRVMPAVGGDDPAVGLGRRVDDREDGGAVVVVARADRAHEDIFAMRGGAGYSSAMSTISVAAVLERRARDLDAADPLRALGERFVPDGDAGVSAYLDGNSLGRPPRDAPARMERFVREAWGGRLIRGWDEGWLEWPEELGDRLGRIALGAATGQVVVADSTSVMLYKLARAALAARADRREIVLDANDFPTDRYVLEGIAGELGLELRFLETSLDSGASAEQIAAVAGPGTALVALSHVNYRSAHIADAATITRIAHDAGALVLWDLSHSAGVVDVALDDWRADVAVGCTYKYLNAGPGSPAFGYVRAAHQAALRQPVQGWLGRRDPFVMGPGYEPADGLRRFVSGTPPILAMVPLACSLDVIEETGLAAIRAKSVALGDYAIELADALLAPHGVTVASPRDGARRGGHVTLRHAGFRALLDGLWRDGVLLDFREPDCLRVGLSPLTTTFAEVHRGFAALAARLAGAER